MRVLSAVLVVVLLSVGVPALAEHPQSSGGKSVAFDHVAGNEWWVEVALKGADAGAVSAVEAQDTNGPWVVLAKKSWGPYAASFHIEPGNTIRFRATFPGGAQVLSCLFTHPTGVEQCGTSATSTTSSTTSTTSSTSTTTTVSDPCAASGTCFDATFKAVRGNEYWVQATVTGLNLAKVDATIDSGANYKPLAKQSWGGYTASFRIVQGSTVQFKATATSGATDMSACYRWIPASNTDATVVACPGSTSTTTSTTGTTSTSSTGTTTAPPRTWQSRSMSQVPGVLNQVFAADIDMDGKGDVVAIGDGLYTLGATGPVQLDMDSWWQGQIANADNDLWPNDLYMVGHETQADANAVMRVDWYNDYRGFRMTPFYYTQDPIGPLHVMDLQDDGLQELYVVHDVASGNGATNATLELVQVGDVISEGPRKVVDFGNGGVDGPLTITAITSGNFSGVPTMLLAAYTYDGMSPTGYLFAVTDDAGTLRASTVATFDGDLMFLEAGDVDGDGKLEAVTATYSDFYVVQEADGAWSSSVVPLLGTNVNVMSASFGNGDGDGLPELYVGADDGKLYVVRPGATGGYATTPIATIAADTLFGPYQVAVGNGDGDTGPEVYTLALDLADFNALKTRVFETAFGQSLFDATFTGVKGNNWWVQASVAANEPLAGVDARVNCGAWKPLTKQSYGWAASFNVPNGSKVDFRARSTTGGTDISGGYLWPNATPTTGC